MHVCADSSEQSLLANCDKVISYKILNVGSSRAANVNECILEFDMGEPAQARRHAIASAARIHKLWM